MEKLLNSINKFLNHPVFQDNNFSELIDVIVLPTNNISQVDKIDVDTINKLTIEGLQSLQHAWDFTYALKTRLETEKNKRDG